MKRLAIILALSAIGCGDDSPTAPSQQVPSLVGGWVGTFSVSVAFPQTGEKGSNTCIETWVISGQAAGAFSGTYQTSGGTTTTCAQAGAVTGSVSAAGTITNLQHSASVGGGLPPGMTCTRLSGSEVLSGVLSGAALTAQGTDRLRCTGFGLTLDADRGMTIAMNRR